MAVVNPSHITQIIHIPAKELILDHTNEDERDDIITRVYNYVAEESTANIEMKCCTDQSLTFKVTGERNAVLHTQNCLLTAFETEIKRLASILGESREHHEWIPVTNRRRHEGLERATLPQISISSVQAESDEITSIGIKESNEEAKFAPESASDERAHIVNHEVVMPVEFCNLLKRTGRKQIRSIKEDCGGVAIEFPTLETLSNKICISGSKDNVEKAKQQLLEMCNEVSNFSAYVRAKVEHHKFLIGKNGANINKIRESSGAGITFPTEKDKDKELITITGNQDAVDKAKAELESAIEKIVRSQLHSTFKEDVTESEITIEPKHHGHFLRRKGEVLHRIREDCGGGQISFTHANFDDNRVVIKGAFEFVKAAEQRMLDIVQELESLVTIECEIPRRHHGIVIGAGCCNLQAIRAEFNVYIKIPHRFPQVEWRSDKRNKNEDVEAIDIVSAIDVVQITGQPDDAEAARHALLSLVPITIKVDVPNDLHGLLIGRGGRDVKELTQKYGVEIVFPGSEGNLDYFTITGIEDRVKEAKEAILEKLKPIKEKYSELKIELDSEYHPKIIENSGAEISKIMSDNDVGIYFPRIGGPDDSIITIIGCQKNLHNARDDLMKIINEVEQRNSVVLDRVLETQDKQFEVSPCESPDLIIHTDITEEEERTLDMSDIHKEYTNVDGQIEIMDKHTEAIPSELDNNVILKQEKTINELREYINDQVLTNKALKVERTKLILKIDSERQECERIIRDNKEKCDEETAKMLNTIKDLEANLKTEREENSMLLAESHEISKRFQELYLAYQMLLGNRESLSNAVKGSKSMHGEVIPSEDFDSANYRETMNKFH